MRKILSAIILFFTLQCTPWRFQDIWVSYQVKRGKHYFKRDKGVTRPSLTTNKGKLDFKAKFTPSCLYDYSVLGNDAKDISKLYGLSDCNTLIHHKHSARFGWRHDGNGQIELFSYVYSDNKADYKYLTTIPVDIEIKLGIRFTDNTYDFYIKDNLVSSHPRKKNCESGIYTRLFPYFGGNKPAPNNMEIFIYEF